jgi:hypothetical protein
MPCTCVRPKDIRPASCDGIDLLCMLGALCRSLQHLHVLPTCVLCMDFSEALVNTVAWPSNAQILDEPGTAQYQQARTPHHGENRRAPCPTDAYPNGSLQNSGKGCGCEVELRCNTLAATMMCSSSLQRAGNRRNRSHHAQKRSFSRRYKPSCNTDRKGVANVSLSTCFSFQQMQLSSHQRTICQVDSQSNIFFVSLLVTKIPR